MGRTGGIRMYKLCKTEQSAIRQRELELVLADMMQGQRYEDISVSEFCSHAGIPRKAFYRYFSSKDGALNALMDHTLLEYEQIREPGDRNPGRSILQELEGFYRFWHMQKPILDALEFSGLSGKLVERALSFAETFSFLQHVRAAENESRQRQAIRFAVSGIMIVMLNWHQDGYRESIREMAELTAQIITQPLLPSLRDFN